jgi:hypothetical protein
MTIQQNDLRFLISKSDLNEFVLPNFQRDFVWAVDKQKTLISTFIVGLPTGNFLTLLGTSKDFAARAVCFNTPIIPSNNCTYLLDGQQRFSTLKNAFQNLYDENKGKWKDTWDSLFKTLRYRYFLKLDDEGKDYFGYQNLHFDKAKFLNLEPSHIFDIITAKKILSNNFKEYFHPGYIAKDRKGRQIKDLALRRARIADHMAEEGIVPLYEILSTASSGVYLHKKVLEKIAHRRSEQLQLEVASNKKKLVKLLSFVDENIQEHVEAKNDVEIQKAWLRLQTNWATDISNYLESLLDYKMLEIELRSSETARAFAIFQVINEPGTPLNEYDLIVAKAARNQKLEQLTVRVFNQIHKPISLSPALTDKIKGQKPQSDCLETFGCLEDNIPCKEVKNRFLQILSVLVYNKIGKEDLTIDHLKRDKILSLTESNINAHCSKALDSLLKAFIFLRYRCGVISIEKIPYKLMVLPIAYCFLNEDNWRSKTVMNRIEYWYWASIFGGHYRQDQNKRALDDMLILEEFASVKKLPSTHFYYQRHDKILGVADYSDKTILLCKNTEYQIPTNIHEAILQYILSNQPYDFFKDSHGKYARLNSWAPVNTPSTNSVVLEDHHICPLFGTKTLDDTTTKTIRDNKKFILNSPLNRTYISKFSNRAIGPMDISKYIDYIGDPATFDHYIKLPVKDTYKRRANESDDEFYERVCSERYEVLLQSIKQELSQLID